MRIPTRRHDFHGYAPDPHLTHEKFNELKAKLERLKNVTRFKWMTEVATLAEGGDFSENAGYQAAKAKLRGVNDAIHYLEEHLKKAIIIPERKTSETIQIGSHVTVEVKGKQKTLLILGSSETDPLKNIISHTSPIGAALLGSRVGAIVRLRVNNIDLSYKVLAIE